MRTALRPLLFATWAVGCGAASAVGCSASIPEIRLYIEPARGFVETTTIDTWMRRKGSFGGRYFGLTAALKEPDDQKTYGRLADFGYWPGGTWGATSGCPAGYYTYVYPYWLVWRARN